jgi:hypothetical protein
MPTDWQVAASHSYKHMYTARQENGLCELGQRCTLANDVKEVLCCMLATIGIQAGDGT